MSMHAPRDLVKRYGLTFHPPPVQGSPYIKPICSLAELYKEGQVMNHCVFSYAEMVYKRQVYIYKIISPERATMALDTCHNEFKISQIKLKYNMEPNEETLSTAEHWITAFKDKQKQPTASEKVNLSEGLTS